MLAQISINKAQIDCLGSWTVQYLDNITQKFADLSYSGDDCIVVDGSQMQGFDSAGALALTHLLNEIDAQGLSFELLGFSEHQVNLTQLVGEKYKTLELNPKSPVKKGYLHRIGKETVHKLHQLDGFIILIGDLSINFIKACFNWRHFQLPSIISNIDFSGLRALPIVGLLSFLIGVVLAYQMGLQLQTYGANIFIAFLSGLAIFREFGPLITAIIVAGRTSSAYTAQIGSMKVNEEVDALKTMGLSTTELLVMPKVLGLFLVFPLLIFWADFFAIIGSMLISKTMLDVGYIDFLNRLQASVGIKHFWVGMAKAPAFAILIALTGCFQGFLVQSSADSIGKQTTKSVVQAIFLIIVADAAFSVMFSKMGV